MSMSYSSAVFSTHIAVVAKHKDNKVKQTNPNILLHYFQTSHLFYRQCSLVSRVLGKMSICIFSLLFLN